MPDRTFLDWPFFESEHRMLAADLETWADAHGEILAAGEDGTDLDAATRAIVSALAEGGWLEHCVPAPWGGRHERLQVRTLCLVREALARRSGLAEFAFAMQGLGGGPISLFGSEAQCSRYLPDIAAGRRLGAFALSEEGAGSDPAAMLTSARADGDFFVLNGTKTWISNAGLADQYVVFARTGEALGAKGISAFVVDAGTPGLRVTERIPVIVPHPLGSLAFEDCRVPAAQLLGNPGDGFKIAMATLDIFRPTVGAAALGFARRALDEAVARSRDRLIGTTPLSDFQMTQSKIADMAVDVDAAALLVYRAAWSKDRGAARITREASMAKLFATEAAGRVVDQAVQIFGGLGVVTGTTVERLYREARALRIYEGTSEIQRIIIAGQVVKGMDKG